MVKLPWLFEDWCYFLSGFIIIREQKRHILEICIVLLYSLIIQLLCFNFLRLQFFIKADLQRLKYKPMFESNHVDQSYPLVPFSYSPLAINIKIYSKWKYQLLKSLERRTGNSYFMFVFKHSKLFCVCLWFYLLKRKSGLINFYFSISL